MGSETRAESYTASPKSVAINRASATTSFLATHLTRPFESFEPFRSLAMFATHSETCRSPSPTRFVFLQFDDLDHIV